MITNRWGNRWGTNGHTGLFIAIIVLTGIAIGLSLEGRDRTRARQAAQIPEIRECAKEVVSQYGITWFAAKRNRIDWLQPSSLHRAYSGERVEMEALLYCRHKQRQEEQLAEWQPTASGSKAYGKARKEALRRLNTAPGGKQER